jgi:hypothetical protein
MTILDIKEIFEKEFKNYLATLKEISREHNGPPVINDQEKLYYNYDKIKKKKVYKGSGEMPASPDTLIFKDDEIVFVEFKNGKIGNIRSEKKKIKLKAIEGGFILLYKIIEKYNHNFLDVVRLNKSFILVYNSEKNPRDEISNRLDFVELGSALEIFKGNFFSNIAVIPSDSFEIEQLPDESGSIPSKKE